MMKKYCDDKCLESGNTGNVHKALQVCFGTSIYGWVSFD